MKKPLILASLVLASQAISFAGTPVPVTELSEATTKVVADYFPGSKILSAEKDSDDGKVKFELKVEYKDLVLEVDVSPEGKILDVDLKD